MWIIKYIYLAVLVVFCSCVTSRRGNIDDGLILTISSKNKSSVVVKLKNTSSEVKHIPRICLINGFVPKNIYSTNENQLLISLEGTEVNVNHGVEFEIDGISYQCSIPAFESRTYKLSFSDLNMAQFDTIVLSYGEYKLISR